MAEAFRKEFIQPTGRNVSDPTRHEIADEDYDVISVIYHCLQGYETAKKYERDARDAGDNELADYFMQVQETHLNIANRGRKFLKEWVNRESVSAASEAQGKSNVEMMPKKEDASGMSEEKSQEASGQVSDADRSDDKERSQAV